MDAAVSLESLQNLTPPAYVQQAGEGATKQSFRVEAIKEAALGLGARGGLFQRTQVINKALKQVARKLDVVYNFGALMINGRVVPPVLLEARDLYSQSGNETIRLAGTSYKVESQARFSSRPPHWRDYLYVDYEDVKMPSNILMPRNDDERVVWKKAIAEGWKAGVSQADSIFDLNLNRLNRDFNGMTKYHVLAYKGMITLPVVAAQSMPINRTGATMYLDETLLRITVLPDFKMDMNSWLPLIESPPLRSSSKDLEDGGEEQ